MPRVCHAFGVSSRRSPVTLPILGAVAVFAVSGFACRATVHADAKANLNEDADPDLEAQLQAERAQSANLVAKANLPAASGSTPLLGARHDLTLAPELATTQCSCLKVGLADSSAGPFRWKAAPPAVDSGSQLVVALSSEGSGCQDPKGSLGASYWGYKRAGDDVVVYVESAVKGRPLTSGAIIPKPFGSGQVFVAPAERGVPYGKASDGKGNCKVGNPGAPRATEPIPNEAGSPAEG